jgi:F1-F0 ATPase (N-ATPase) AtpR subunit
MIWVVMAVCGFLLGLAYFGSLWLSVRHMLQGRHRPHLIDAGRLLRLGLFGVAVAVLCVHAAGTALGILPGLWLARWSVVHYLGEVRHGA